VKHSFAWAVVVVGLLVIGCGGGGGGGGTSDGSTNGNNPGPLTDLRVGALRNNVFLDPTNVQVGQTVQLKVYGRSQNGQILEATATNWTTDAPASVATVTANGIVTGVGPSGGNIYTVSASATGSTVSSPLAVKLAQARVTGTVNVGEDAAARPIAGAKLRFFTEGGVEVGSAVTGHNGTFDAAVPTSATRFIIDISSSGAYYSQFKSGAHTYATELDSCRAPLPALTDGQTRTLSTPLTLFLRSAGGPPPPPSGCLD
jgi:hypothetical protein